MKFEIGKTYKRRLITKHDEFCTITVLKRTAKTLTASTDFGVKTLRIKDKYWYGVEHVEPWGRYSMSPIVGADDVVQN